MESLSEEEKLERKLILNHAQMVDRLLKGTSDALGGVRYEDLPKVCQRFKDELEEMDKEIGKRGKD